MTECLGTKAAQARKRQERPPSVLSAKGRSFASLARGGGNFREESSRRKPGRLAYCLNCLATRPAATSLDFRQVGLAQPRRFRESIERQSVRFAKGAKFVFHERKFAKHEPTVNPFVRNYLNDSSTEIRHYRTMERIGPKRPHWFIREWREHRRWTQEELADRAEMTKSMISEFESGKKRLNDDHVGMFCMVFGIEPQDLLRAPSGPDPIERMLRHAAPEKRDQAARIIEAFLKAG